MNTVGARRIKKMAVAFLVQALFLGMSAWGDPMPIIFHKKYDVSLEKVQPDLIIYNAGTDIFEKDPIGKMRVSKEGIIERDYFVFSQARERKIPVLMVLSGGYSPDSAGIIGESIENILNKQKLVPVRTR